jgi:drug/metabolite transporter superfamily protein YnfA
MAQGRRHSTTPSGDEACAHHEVRGAAPPSWDQHRSVVSFMTFCVAAGLVAIASVAEGACFSIEGCPPTSRAVPHATVALFILLGLVAVCAVVATTVHRARAARLCAAVGGLVLVSLAVLHV